MPWQFTRDVEEFAARAGELLAAQPVANTVALGALGSLRAGRRWSADPMLFGWYDDGPAVTAAVLRTPPYELHLVSVTETATPALVRALRQHGVQLPGVTGEAAAVESFAANWSEQTGQRPYTRMLQRLYLLDRLRPPDPVPPGRARAATASDVDLLARWVEAFQQEVGTHRVDATEVVTMRVAAGLLWVWQDAGGRIVSLAGRNPAAAGVARIGPVYTDPEQRRHGYGAAVTAACASAALQQDAGQVVLFTDLANPTSNAIYRQIGFRPLHDTTVVGFEPV